MSVEHYKRVTSVLTEAALILTSTGQILAANRPAVRMLGVESASLEGSLLQSFADPSANDLLSYLRLCARSTEALVGSVTLETSEGIQTFTTKGAVLEPRSSEKEPILFLQLSLKREATARFRALKSEIGELNQEVSKRLRVEYELRAQTTWLQVTLASIGDAVITTDSQGSVTFMNPVAEAMTGWTRDDAVGTPLNDVFVAFNEYTQEPVENPAEKALRERKVVALANHAVLVAKDGSRVSIEDSAAPIVLDEEIKGAILVFHDVSARRSLEKQLMERAERLELANRRKNEFLTMLAHELRSPLAPISNAVQIMCMQADKPASFDEPRAVISRQVQHLKRLVDDMLDVSRIIRGKMRIVRKKLDFSSLVSEACSDFQVQFHQAGISLTTAMPPSPIWISADAHRMTQVIHNLLTNAVKFTQPDGSVNVALSVERSYATLRITDTGVGIDESTMSDLFEPFTQAAQNLDRSGGGLGLGLSLVKGIVDLHDGRIFAASRGTYKGTAITVQLPLAGESDKPADASETAPAYGRTHRVLLIEDERDAAATMRQLLELLGHEVHIAKTGPEGLKKAMALKPSLVVCDIGLPGLDGFAVAERLRRSAITSSIPLVALTGYGDSEFVDRAKKAGFDIHITKPASMDDLQKVLALRERPASGA